MAKSLHERYGEDAPKVLQNLMVDNAPALPEPYQLKYHPTISSRVIIVNTKTGAQLEIGLCNLQGAAKAIRTFANDHCSS